MRAVRWKAPALRAGLSLFVVILASCGGGTDLPTQPGGGGVLVNQIVITPDGGTIIAGQTMSFTAQAKDAAGNPVSQALAWSVNDAAIASVSQGVVTARKPGAATLSATNGTVTKAVTISVVAAVDHIDLTPSPDSIVITQTSQLTATLRDSAGASLTGRAVTWTSSSDAMASVSATGLVTAKVLGSATVTASAEGKSGTTTIVVHPIPVSTVAIAPLTSPLTVGDNVQLSATTKDSAGNVLGRSVTWTSSDVSVGTVSATGLLTAKAAGSTTITAAVEGKSATLKVDVQAPRVASVTVTPATPTLAAGRTVQFTAALSDAQGQPVSGRPVTWATSDTALATVGATGLVTTRSQGQVTITASSDGKSGGTAVTVVDLTPPTVVGLSITPSTVDVSSGAQPVTFAATVKDAGGSGVQRINFAILAPNGAVNTCSGLAPEPGGTTFNGIWKCMITVPAGAPPGDWTISIVALDAALNHTSLGTTELRAANLPTKFVVVNAHPDTTPPTLVRLDYTPTTVDVSTGAQTIAVAAHLTDAGSGVARFDFSITAPNGVSMVGCSAFAPVAPGTAADGTWQCSVVVPAGAQPGSWSIKAGAVDASYNTALILPPQTITVTDAAPDLTPPTLASLTITPQTVDASYVAQIVTVSARLTDAQSGVAQFTFRAVAPDSTKVECSAYQPDAGAGTTADGTWSCRFTIPPGIALGDWLVSVQLADKALNVRQYGTTELGALGMPTKFTVISTTTP
jgi:uncharacterized protein YjdB